MKKVVGVLGKAGSGKSTVAKYMEEKYGAQRLSIARPLKVICQKVFGFTDEQVWGDAKVKETIDPRWGITPRKAMQDISLAGKEVLGEDVWFKGLLHEIAQSDGELFVIEDLRYISDAAFVAGLKESSLRGYVIKLVCEDDYSKDAGTHPSEAEVDKVPSELIHGMVASHISPGSTHLKRVFQQVLWDLQVV